MWLELSIRYIHFISIFLLVSSVVAEYILIKKQNTGKEISLLAKIDAFYGLGSILVVGAGLALWLWVGKDESFYADNPLFWLKFSLVILLGLLSIYPSIFFFKNKIENPNKDIKIPKWVRYFIYAEVIVIGLIPLLAVLMARGISL